MSFAGSAVMLALAAMVGTTGAGCEAHGPETTEQAEESHSSTEQSGAEETSSRLSRLETPHLQLPRSNSLEVWERTDDGVQIALTTREIRVDGEAVVSAPVEPLAIRGKGERRVIVPLLEYLEERHGPESAGAEGAEVDIVADRTVPYERVARTIFTAGRAGLGGYTFVVAGPDGEDVYEIEVTRPCLSESIDEKEPSRVGDWKACYEESDGGEETPLNLTVAVGADGITLGATGAILPARDDCPVEGPTICLEEPSFDVEAEFERVRALVGRDGPGERERVAALLREIEGAYDWRGMHRLLREIHQKFPEYREYVIAGESQMPFGLVVRAMDVARYRLEGEEFEDAESFRDALMGRYVSPESAMALFPEVVLSL